MTRLTFWGALVQREERPGGGCGMAERWEEVRLPLASAPYPFPVAGAGTFDSGTAAVDWIVRRAVLLVHAGTSERSVGVI